MIIASGERSQFPNVGPTDRKLKKGDIIRMEIFGQKNGYLAGVCRTAVVGGATPERRASSPINSPVAMGHRTPSS